MAISIKRNDSKEDTMPKDDDTLNNGDGLVLLLSTDRDSSAKGSELKVISWSDEYSTGIPLIDEEHHKLIKLVNDYILTLLKADSQKNMTKTFDTLISYTSEHFSNEEKLMESHSYPEVKNHKIEHKRLIETVMELNREKGYVLKNNISDFLERWIADHILYSDKEFARWMDGWRKG